ncbi:cupin domain-containing protein [Sphaerisporangium sp. TRM90804]|uniref:cupin domain-containing protein n=1 Tax=Sphaerisporangium sp. TRM90804 TaxID=3031113 RepID=UPI0024489682|nr:cupin domain-containing protein [Sphaerisporangium sp. TRM90804]MDH2427208.1 cupin domain-containing protein [Sphaerisporangium sp. TRM90804]
MNHPTKISVAGVAPNLRRGGDIRVLLSPKTVGSTSGFSGVLTLGAGEHVSEHYHPYSEEFLYVVRGSLVMRLDGEPVTLEPGEALLVPKNVRHRLENPGPDPAEVVFHLSPLAPRPELGHVDTEPHVRPEEGPLPAVHAGGGS